MNYLKALLHMIVVNILCSILIILTLVTALEFVSIATTFIIALVVSIIISFLYYKKFGKKVYKELFNVYIIYIIILLSVFTIAMFIKNGNALDPIFANLIFLAFSYALPLGLALLVQSVIDVLALVFIIIVCQCIFVWLHLDNRQSYIKKTMIPVLVFLIVCGSVDTYLYMNRPQVKYAGHGFDYMHGYSTTDFSDYTVYAKNSKLNLLDHDSVFMIENEKDMPVIDGAEACYPLYASIAKTIYKDIDKIEESFLENADDDDKNIFYNGKIVSFTNTKEGMYRLVEKDVDLFFGARPSSDALEFAKECNVELEVTPIGKEAFVFFVDESNPINNLTSEEVRKIYSGEITNWSEVGGKNEKIRAFQRPEASGSQVMMHYFMKDTPLKEPDTYEMVGGMGEVLQEVAQYASEDGAMGYSFRYFVEDLAQEKNVKVISIDGISPTKDNIKNGSYPLVTSLCLITRKEDNPQVDKVKEFVLSEDGQALVEMNGYTKLK